MVIRVFLLLLLSCLPVFAGGVGYVNYDKVVANYQFAKTSLREIETKNNEIQQYLLNKEKEFDKIEKHVTIPGYEDVEAGMAFERKLFVVLKRSEKEIRRNSTS